MTDAALFTEIATWLDQHVLVSTGLAVFGAAASFAVAGLILIYLLKGLAALIGASDKSSNRAIRKAAQEPGYRVLIGDVDGPQGNSARDVIEKAFEEHCGSFSFGARFMLFRVASPGGRPEGEALARARKRLEKTGADMLVWGARIGEEVDGLRLFGVSRGGNLTPQQARPFSISLPGRHRQFVDVHARAVAYLLAKRLQPALSRPEAFREEKIAELGTTLDEILDELSGEEVIELPAEVHREIETDFSAITLHLSDRQPRMEWLDKLIMRRRATLDTLKGQVEADAQIDARLDLGRALIKRAEISFDPVALREASVHLNSAIDALRQHDVIRRAQNASDALARAQSLVETRRRFAVNFSA